MGYMNDSSRIFLYQYDEDRLSASDLAILNSQFQKREFQDGKESYYYDFRFVPTGKLLELKHRIPDNNDNNRRKNPGELLLSDFMQVEQISLLSHFDYAGEKIHGAISQEKTYEITEFWEYHYYCYSADLVRLTSELLNFATTNPDTPILTYLEIWDNHPEGDRNLLLEELNKIRLLAELGVRNGLDMLLLPTLDF